MVLQVSECAHFVPANIPLCECAVVYVLTVLLMDRGLDCFPFLAVINYAMNTLLSSFYFGIHIYLFLTNTCLVMKFLSPRASIWSTLLDSFPK